MHRIKGSNGEWLYFINPAYHVGPGWRLSATLYSFFREELDPILPDNIREEFRRRAPERVMFSDEALDEAEDILKGGIDDSRL
jgi:hypothetical protein